EGTGSIPGVPDVPTDESEEKLSWNSTDNEGDADEGKDGDGDDNGDDGEEGDGDDDDEDDDGEEGDDDDDDDQEQVAMDEALVPHAQRLRIGRSKFRLLSDIISKESTLQLVYDVLRICPFFKAFLVTADVPEIYMQEFWVTATIHHHAIRFKMDKMKHIMNLKSFRDMLHICPRVHGQSFVEPPFEKEIIAFIRFLKHNLVYQVEHKNTKKSNEMYYPWFTKVIIHHFMSKDPSIPRRNKVNWHYVRDDNMFYTIKLVSRHQNTQQFGALLPIDLTNKEIKNSNAYKEDYQLPHELHHPSLRPGKQVGKAFKSKSQYVLSEVAMTEAQQLKLVTKRSLQQTHISQATGSGADEGTSSIPRVPDVPTDESEEELSWNSTDDEGDDDEGKDGDGNEEDEGDDGDEGDGDVDEDDDGEEGNDDDDDQEVERDDDKDDEEEGEDDDQEYDEEEYDEETRDEESFDPIPKTPKNSEDEGNGEEEHGLNIGGEEGHVEEEEKDKLYKDANINQGRGIQATLEVKESYVTLTPLNPDRQQQSSSVSSQFVTSMLNPTLDVDEQRNLYKALVEAYESDKIILDTYEETVTLKRRRDDDAAKDEEPSAGPDRGSKRRREGKEPESASAPRETATRSVDRSTQGSRSRQASTSESAIVDEPMRTTF
nr:hypothetical protein [Tanacetum cinerariifolium]